MQVVKTHKIVIPRTKSAEFEFSIKRIITGVIVGNFLMAVGLIAVFH